MTNPLQHAFVFGLVLLFLIQMYRAWDKYSQMDIMIVTELEESEKQIFPSVTICKHQMIERRNESTEEDYEFNSVINNWLKFKFDAKE